MYRVVQCGYRYKHPIGFTIDRSYGTSDYLLVLFHSNVEICLPQGDIYTECPSLIIYDKNTKQLYSGERTPMVADWFHFDTEQKGFLEELGLAFNTVYYPNNIVELSEIVRSLQYNEMFNAPYGEEIAHHLISCFLFMLAQNICRPHKSYGNSSQLQELSYLREEIYSNPQMNWNIEMLSQKMFLSRSHFQMLYSRAFGISPMNDVIHSRIRFAKYLLSTTPEITIERTASLCGYNSSIHLIRQFKKITGKTPLQYKKDILEITRSY